MAGAGSSSAKKGFSLSDRRNASSGRVRGARPRDPRRVFEELPGLHLGEFIRVDSRKFAFDGGDGPRDVRHDLIPVSRQKEPRLRAEDYRGVRAREEFLRERFARRRRTWACPSSRKSVRRDGVPRRAPQQRRQRFHPRRHLRSARSSRASVASTASPGRRCPRTRPRHRHRVPAPAPTGVRASLRSPDSSAEVSTSEGFDPGPLDHAPSAGGRRRRRRCRAAQR